MAMPMGYGQGEKMLAAKLAELGMPSTGSFSGDLAALKGKVGEVSAAREQMAQMPTAHWGGYSGGGVPRGPVSTAGGTTGLTPFLAQLATGQAGSAGQAMPGSKMIGSPVGGIGGGFGSGPGSIGSRLAALGAMPMSETSGEGGGSIRPMPMRASPQFLAGPSFIPGGRR